MEGLGRFTSTDVLIPAFLGFKSAALDKSGCSKDSLPETKWTSLGTSDSEVLNGHRIWEHASESDGRIYVSEKGEDRLSYIHSWNCG